MSAEAPPNSTTVVADVGATSVWVALSGGGALGRIKERRGAQLHCGGDDGILPGIRRVIEIVGAVLGVPVAIDDDANMTALGERRHGAGRGLHDFLLITRGANIGMGIVDGGRILRGAQGDAGEGGMMLAPARSLDQPDDEFGHRVVDAGRFGAASESRARRLYAWVEELVGGGALARALSERREAGSDRAERPTGPLRVLADAVPGDSDAASVVDRAIEGCAYIIANYVALLDPAAIVLSGGLAEDIGPFLERLRRRTAALSRAEPLVLDAELGSIGGLVGASAAAITMLGTMSASERSPNPAGPKEAQAGRWRQLGPILRSQRSSYPLRRRGAPRRSCPISCPIGGPTLAQWERLPTLLAALCALVHRF